MIDENSQYISKMKNDKLRILQNFLMKNNSSEENTARNQAIIILAGLLIAFIIKIIALATSHYNTP